MTRESPLRPTRRAGPWPPAALVERGLGDSRVAFGLAGIGGAWGPVDPGLARETLQLAFSLGVHVFDAAPAYGTAESLLGEALRTWRGPRPIVSTKVGRLPGRDALEMRYEHGDGSLRDSLRRSLDLLGLPAVDLLFLHEPEEVPRGERARVAATLQQLRADGLAHRLGLGGGDGPAWDGFLETGAFDVVMLFRRLDACIFDGLAAELPRLRRAGLATYGASPLHMGLLGGRHREFLERRPEWVWPGPAARAVRLRELAEARGVSLPMLAHRFAFSLEELDRVVIGARSPAELQDAWAAFAAGPLPAELFDAVCATHK
ncbi:MAG: aldo/keto reductase [Verrucomicrobia bacterium]|nr:aldo/keto reductase [Verrucomicrobiota bacterium]